ncbi:predicted protein [Naegleria gruberi]|uniref:Predicted protein n=1 Tax=Naegleria gruberi TaxID=5762 RepID=D2VXF0_NAEGR|nr:uncharacterized protein NAEGRDRAFT_53013 [Naegleria gruberi]EFC38498.1 predicted protein [Naegleria gruberi]|eukprot:XP_002671242.1 predicted protein [Naegleria gruberi strain NEG-M]
MSATRSSRIIKTLTNQFSPIKLSIKNISKPYENDGAHNDIFKQAGGESHLRITIVSDNFEGQTMVKRHRMIHKAISDEFRDGLHALTIHAKTQYEYNQSLERMRKIREDREDEINEDEDIMDEDLRGKE